jgi:DNA gyrase subunit A
MGRTAAGVNAMRLDSTDFITSMEVVDDSADLLVVTEKGYGKRTPLKQYPVKGRATGGVMTIDQKNLSTTGRIVSARIVMPEDDLTVISAGGVALRTKMANVRQAGRATMGTRIITLKDGDVVASVARMAAADLTTGGAEETPTNGNGNGKAEDTGEIVDSIVEVSEN